MREEFHTSFLLAHESQGRVTCDVGGVRLALDHGSYEGSFNKNGDGSRDLCRRFANCFFDELSQKIAEALLVPAGELGARVSRIGPLDGRVLERAAPKPGRLEEVLQGCKESPQWALCLLTVALHRREEEPQNAFFPVFEDGQNQVFLGREMLVQARLGLRGVLTSNSAALSQVVTAPTSTLTTITTTSNPSTPGTPVTFVALVFAANPVAGSPSGTVTLLDGATPLGTAPVSGGMATFTTAALSAGVHAITAVSSGSSAFVSSRSIAVSQLVTEVPPVVAAAPVVTGLRRTGIHLQPTSLILNFSEPLNPARVQDLSNYRLVLHRRGRHPATIVIGLRSAVYDPVLQTVTLSPRGRLSLRLPYQLTVRRTAPQGITRAAGQFLDGQGNGQPGSNYRASIVGDCAPASHAGPTGMTVLIGSGIFSHFTGDDVC